MEERCECVFCDYRRSIDSAEVLKELAEDPKYVKHIEERIGSLGDQENCRAALAAAMMDILPLAMDLQARLSVSKEKGLRDPFELIDVDQFDVYLNLTVSLMALVQAAGFSDLESGAGMRERIRVFGKMGGYGYGSNKLQ